MVVILVVFCCVLKLIIWLPLEDVANLFGRTKIVVYLPVFRQGESQTI